MLAALSLLPLALASVSASTGSEKPSTVKEDIRNCRCTSRDSCWPSADQWKQLNSTVHGRLLATVPIGSPCHDPLYDAASCAILRDDWTEPQTHLLSSSSVMWPFFANNSCSPFTAKDTSCTLGNYVSYAFVTLGTTYLDVQLEQILLLFGHITLKLLRCFGIPPPYYTGPAVKAGAGVSGAQMLETADSHGLVAVTGECPTVGTVGGYSQGGGLSVLSTAFGLGADQVLEWEAVTTSGDIVTAKPGHNEDLYWALSGGGGGTYAIVTSAVIKLHPTAIASGASFTLLANSTSSDNYAKTVAAFLRLIPQMADNGASIIYLHTADSFLLTPLTVFNATIDYVRDVLAPFQSVVDGLGLVLDITYDTYDTYKNYFTAHWGPLPYGFFPVESNTYGSRLIPRTVLESGDSFPEVEAKIVATGAMAVGFAGSFSPANYPNNSVLPAWRDASIHVELQLPFNESDWQAGIAAQALLSDELVPMMEEITPGGGSYMNEAGWELTDWKESFFGQNYDKLLRIKNKWDPSGLLYGLKLVGSDAWVLDANGRLCRA
ncbi:hypothetical protein TrVGV298_008195 [Trichoderma virens]|nr:hypothetical protein TrVGV298_008195 [Trichoderma virens]